MAGETNDGQGFPIATVLLLVAAAVGGFFQMSALDSLRPKQDQLSKSHLNQENAVSVVARLWEDPFRAVHLDIDRIEKTVDATLPVSRVDDHNENGASDILDIMAKLKGGGGDVEKMKITVLGVVVDGLPYPESAEHRIRTRHAVSTALLGRDYYPEDRNRIQYKIVERESGGKAESLAAATYGKLSNVSGYVIPFEWFDWDSCGDGKKEEGELDKKVLVFWVRNTDFREDFAERARFLNSIEGSIISSGVKKENLNMAIVGPDNSDELLGLKNAVQEYHRGLNSEINDRKLAEKSLGNVADAIKETRRDQEVKQQTIKEHAKKLNAVLCRIEEQREQLKYKRDMVIALNRMVASGAGGQGDVWYEKLFYSGLSNWLERVELEGAINAIQQSLNELNEKLAKYEFEREKYKDDIDKLDGLIRFVSLDITFYSPRASAYKKSDFEQFGENGLKFVFVTQRDERLLGTILDEFQRRAILGNSPRYYKRGENEWYGKSVVVLISEWDTYYGRAMVDGFKRQAGEHAYFRQEGVGENVHVIKYMRGLDGYLSGTGDRLLIGKNVYSNDEAKKGEAGAFERLPVGPAQFDYLRRITAQIQALEDDGYHIAAIGILGTDVYDKLLILRALRDPFADSLFFTTDYDARLLHMSERKWTRNLLVTTSFGGDVSPGFSQNFPKFRGTYQTSTYLATGLALGDEGEQFDISKLSPRLFEIGANREVELFPGFKLEDEKEGRIGTQKKSEVLAEYAYLSGVMGAPCGLTLKPVERQLPGGYGGDVGAFAFWGQLEDGELLYVYAGFFLVCVLTMAMHFTLPNRDVLGSVGTFFYWAGGGMLFLGALVFVWWMAVRAFGSDSIEPAGVADLWQGVSAWPTIWLRGFGAILAAYFIFWSYFRLRVSDRKLSNDYCLEKSFGLSFSLKGFAHDHYWLPGVWEYLRVWVGVHLHYLFYLESLGKLVAGEKNAKYFELEGGEVEGFWRLYMLRSRFYGVVLFVWLSVEIYYAIIAKLFFAQIPSPTLKAIRGEDVLLDYWGVTMAVVFIFLYLVFFVLKATIDCLLFAYGITSAKCTEGWPDKVRQKYLPAGHRMPVGGRDALDYWLDIRFIAKRTEVVGKLIVFPFVILFLLYLSDLRVLDAWDMSTPVIIVRILILSIAVVAAVFLRRVAERARKNRLGLIRKEVKRAKEDPCAPRDFCVGTVVRESREGGEIAERKERESAQYLSIADIERYEKEVLAINDGAFSSVSRNPILVGILVPFGGMGTVTLLEYLSRAGT